MRPSRTSSPVIEAILFLHEVVLLRVLVDGAGERGAEAGASGCRRPGLGMALVKKRSWSL